MLALLGRNDVRVYRRREPYSAQQGLAASGGEGLRRQDELAGCLASPLACTRGHPALPQGMPTTKASDESASEFMVQMVRATPDQVTMFWACTNVAIAIEPRFAELARELVLVGPSVSPHTQMKAWPDNLMYEINLWFDPEAASAVLHPRWGTERVLKSNSIAANYLHKHLKRPLSGIRQIAWDEPPTACFNARMIKLFSGPTPGLMIPKVTASA